MADYEEPVAREVIEYLRSAKLVRNDASLAKAAQSSAPEKNTTIKPRDNHRAETSLAISRLQKSIHEGKTEAEALELWRKAVTAAQSWLNARL
jgi:tRNA A37 N6-isopentenylltransferase MiaA